MSSGLPTGPKIWWGETGDIEGQEEVVPAPRTQSWCVGMGRGSVRPSDPIPACRGGRRQRQAQDPILVCWGRRGWCQPVGPSPGFQGREGAVQGPRVWSWHAELEQSHGLAPPHSSAKKLITTALDCTALDYTVIIFCILEKIQHFIIAQYFSKISWHYGSIGTWTNISCHFLNFKMACPLLFARWWGLKWVMHVHSRRWDP